jgi:phosphoglycolate phosphatase
VTAPDPIAAVLFDLDGTLLDTLQDLADSGNAALEVLGYPTHRVDAYRHFVGDGMAVLAQRILPAHVTDPAMQARCLDVVREQYAQRWNHSSRPYDGVEGMLDALAEDSVPMAVLSNKPHDFTRLTVEHLLARWTFAEVQGVDADTPPKPDASGALAMTARLQLEPSRCLYVGDTRIDMETATAADMIPVGVTWGFRDEEELRAHGARHIIHHPDELLDLT